MKRKKLTEEQKKRLGELIVRLIIGVLGVLTGAQIN